MRSRQPSVREVQVLALIADGKTVRQAAAALEITPATVKAHLYRLGDLAGNGTQAGLVGWAFRNGYLT